MPWKGVRKSKYWQEALCRHKCKTLFLEVLVKGESLPNAEAPHNHEADAVNEAERAAVCEQERRETPSACVS